MEKPRPLGPPCGPSIGDGPEQLYNRRGEVVYLHSMTDEDWADFAERKAAWSEYYAAEAEKRAQEKRRAAEAMIARLQDAERILHRLHADPSSSLPPETVATVVQLLEDCRREGVTDAAEARIRAFLSWAARLLEVQVWWPEFDFGVGHDDCGDFDPSATVRQCVINALDRVVRSRTGAA